MKLKPGGFTRASPDSVPDDGFAEGFRGGETDARRNLRGIGEAEGRKECAAVPQAAVIDFPEIAGSEKAGTLWKA
jgi:hypothetical protein